MSASSLIAVYGKTVSVTRVWSGGYVNGSYVAGAPTVLTPVMSIQPMGGKELLNLPEAQRTRRFVRGYTAIELFTAEQAPSKKADVVISDGVTYEVQKVEHWQSEGNTIEPFWKVIMAEVNP